MNFEKASKSELIVLIGEQDTKINDLLAQLEQQGVEILSLKSGASDNSENSDQSKLQQIIEELTKDALDWKLANESLSNQVNDLTLANENLISKNEDLQENLDESELLLEELKRQVNAAEDQVNAITGTVKVIYKGKGYVSVLPRFHHDGVSYEADQLKNNPELVADLIENELGVLRLDE